jgi:hypothetical protein
LLAPPPGFAAVAGCSVFTASQIQHNLLAFRTSRLASGIDRTNQILILSTFGQGDGRVERSLSHSHQQGGSCKERVSWIRRNMTTSSLLRHHHARAQRKLLITGRYSHLVLFSGGSPASSISCEAMPAFKPNAGDNIVRAFYKVQGRVCRFGPTPPAGGCRFRSRRFSLPGTKLRMRMDRVAREM